jgi:hypothetical protein
LALPTRKPQPSDFRHTTIIFFCRKLLLVSFLADTPPIRIFVILDVQNLFVVSFSFLILIPRKPPYLCIEGLARRDTSFVYFSSCGPLSLFYTVERVERRMGAQNVPKCLLSTHIHTHSPFNEWFFLHLFVCLCTLRFWPCVYFCSGLY